MIETLNDIAQIWFNWQWAMMWQTTVLIGIVALIDRLIRKWAWPQLRYALWLLILVKLVLPPSLTSPVSLTSVIPKAAENAIDIKMKTPSAANRGNSLTTLPVWPSTRPVSPEMRSLPTEAASMTPEAGSTAGTTQVSKTAGIAQTRQEPSVSSVQASHAVTPTLSGKVYLLAMWLLGVVGLCAGLLLRLKGLHTEHLGDSTGPAPTWFADLVKRTAQELHCHQVPKVVLSTGVCCPAVFGLLQPVLLVPADRADSMSKQDARYVLLHELAHIKRGDLWWHTAYMVLVIFYWCNPLVWLIRKHLQNLRELCCDATVARHLREDTHAYRGTLLETARDLVAQPVDPGLGMLGLFENSNWLVTRLQWLQKKTWRYPKTRIITITLLGAIMLMCIVPMAQAQTPEFTIRGRVLDAQTGEPIAGATVGDANDYADGQFQTQTDSDGQYAYNTWYEEHMIIARAPGYLPQEEILITKWIGKEKDKAIDFELESRAKVTMLSPYKARFANGAVVEIAGICKARNNQGTWFLPDGRILNEPLYDDPPISQPYPIGSKTKTPESQTRTYDVVVRYANLPEGTGHRFGVDTVIPKHGGIIWGAIPGNLKKDGKLIENMTYIRFSVRKRLNVCSVNIGLAMGPWKTHRAHSKGRKGGWGTLLVTPSKTEKSPNSVCAVSEPMEHNGSVCITVTHDIKQLDSRVVVTDYNGVTHEPVQCDRSRVTGFNRSTLMFDIPLRTLSEIRVQKRPYQWIEFGDIALLPHGKDQEANDSRITVQAGLPESGQKGYDLFDHQKSDVSPFVQSVNLKRALEEELGRTIQTLDCVIYARVHVVTPEHDLFASQAQETTATVVLRTKPGHKLSAMNIAAISQIVANSVEGVRTEGVTLVDSEGRLLSGESEQNDEGNNPPIPIEDRDLSDVSERDRLQLLLKDFNQAELECDVARLAELMVFPDESIKAQFLELAEHKPDTMGPWDGKAEPHIVRCRHEPDGGYRVVALASTRGHEHMPVVVSCIKEDNQFKVKLDFDLLYFDQFVTFHPTGPRAVDRQTLERYMSTWAKAEGQALVDLVQSKKHDLEDRLLAIENAEQKGLSVAPGFAEAFTAGLERLSTRSPEALKRELLQEMRSELEQTSVPSTRRKATPSDQESKTTLRLKAPEYEWWLKEPEGQMIIRQGDPLEIEWKIGQSLYDETDFFAVGVLADDVDVSENDRYQWLAVDIPTTARKTPYGKAWPASYRLIGEMNKEAESLLPGSYRIVVLGFEEGGGESAGDWSFNLKGHLQCVATARLIVRPQLTSNLEEPRTKAGATNLALNKPVTSSVAEPILGELSWITDGNKEASGGSLVELEPFTQHITIDLEQTCEIYAIRVWHYYKQARVYLDVVAQVACDGDAEFTTDVQTVFNNDDDNSSGLGVGTDGNYVETPEGKLIDLFNKDVKGRYVRLYSNGNNAYDENHYLEVEVYGKPAARLNATPQPTRESVGPIASGALVETRDTMNKTLHRKRDEKDQAIYRTLLAELAEQWLFERRVFAGDKLCEIYPVKPGDSLSRIGDVFKVPHEFLIEINEMRQANALRPGQELKVVHGPFHVKVRCSAKQMDLYLQDIYVKSYDVGMGKPKHETPTGLWRVKPGGKLIRPAWTDPKTGRHYSSDDPDYPLGARWIGLEGVDGNAVGRMGFAIHGVEDVKDIGKQTSKGCIVLRNSDAVQLFNMLVPGLSEVQVLD